MFAAFHGEESAPRFMRRGRLHGRFRDVDWGALITAGATLTASVVNMAVTASKGGSQQNQPTTFSCPQGYVYDTPSNTCQRVVVSQGGGGGPFDNIDSTTLLIGGGLLAILLLGRN